MIFGKLGRVGSVGVLAACAAGTPAPVPAPAVPLDAEIARVPATPVIDSLLPLPPSSLELPRLSRVHRGAEVCAGGDVMLGSNLDSSWARDATSRLGFDGLLPPPDSLLAPLVPLVAGADVVMLNVEGAIGDGPAPRKCRRGSTNCYAFRQLPGVAGALARVAPLARVVGNVANNHAMDAGALGFDATVQHLQDNGVAVTGPDSTPTLVPLLSGDTIAFLGFSTFEAGLDARDLAAVRRYVARARTRWPLLVVSAHMGAEGRAAQRTRDTTEVFLGEDRGNSVAFAHTAVDAGAAVVFMHGPHVLRAAEQRGSSAIFYSLGNLLTYGPFNMAEPLNRGGLACVRLDARGRVSAVTFRSTHQITPGVVQPDPTDRALRLIDSLSALDFPRTALRLRAPGAPASH